MQAVVGALYYLCHEEKNYETKGHNNYLVSVMLLMASIDDGFIDTGMTY